MTSYLKSSKNLQFLSADSFEKFQELAIFVSISYITTSTHLEAIKKKRGIRHFFHNSFKMNNLLSIQRLQFPLWFA
jgi:hypothetical protein